MSDRVLLGTRKGLFLLKRANAGAWKIQHAAFVGDNVPMLLPNSHDGAWYAALNHGHFGNKLHRSIDQGRSWTEIGVPAYPEKAPGEPDELLPMSGQPWPKSLKLVWALESAGPDRADCLWCGTIPGGLFFSRDRGQSWQLVNGLWDHPSRREWFGGGADYPGIHSVCVDPRDSRVVRVGVSCGGVWATRDGGETWNCEATGMRAEYMPPERQFDPNIQDPHRLVQCPTQPDRLWVQHHNGIFRSVNGGAQWEEITGVQPSVFGFGVVVHPRQADTAWFVPAIKDEKRIPVDGRLVVTRTRDGGKTFDVLRGGLPQEHAYDLVFRHALDIDPSGDRLVFGSTTGSVWISENQGDSWSTVSTHLPPVYCARFVA